MALILTFICIAYIALLGACYYQWRKIVTVKSTIPSDRLPGVSVVVAMRNEASNVKPFCLSLINQNYPRDKFEVIVVDDDSQDETPEELEHFSKSQPNIYQYSMDSTPNFKGSFKKRALNFGISKARFYRIITTDADCIFPEAWLATMIGFMENNALQFVSGPVRVLKGNVYGSSLWELESTALMVMGASFIEWGQPNMCNGANLGFTKKAFEEVGGYLGFETVVSGDDEFLLYKIWRRYPGKVRFIKHPDAMVDTAPPQSWREMFHQRKRWSGKWRHHRFWVTRGLAMFIFLFHFNWLMMHLGAFMGWFPWLWLGLLWILKIGSELLVTLPAFRFQGKKFPWRWFFIGQLLYSPYAVIFGLMANWGKYHWKNRSYP